MSETQIKE